MMNGRSRSVAPPASASAILWMASSRAMGGGYSALHDTRLLLVQGDDGELEIPVALTPDQGHVALVLRPPRRLRGEAQRVVDLLEEAQQLQGLAVLALVAIELVRESAPLHHPALLDIGCEIAGVLVRIEEHLLDTLHVHVTDLLADVCVLCKADCSGELREAIQAAVGTVAVGVEGHGHRAIHDLSGQSGAVVVLHGNVFSIRKSVDFMPITSYPRLA